MKDPLEKLITSYRKKLDYKPENAALLSQIAEFYYTQGKLEEALSACQQALQLQPGLATASLTLKKVEQSLADLDSWTPGLAIKNWLELDAESVSNYPDIIVRMFQGEVSGMLIKQVFSKEEIAQVIYRLKSEKEAWVAHKLGSILGSPFLKPGIDGTQYFMEALTWRVELSHI
ncbi:MAG: tetratricopeptide repeat protein, partial [Coleofasciculus sp. S288]|nr:tetratricopeptide repeat protein [Coleofasciculus sp. S288]